LILKEGSFNPDEDEFVDKEIVNFKSALDMVKGGHDKGFKNHYIIAVFC
jgi:hypothetical protein